MALRDPGGVPRRNPLFPVDDPREERELRAAPGNAVGPLLTALQDAGPEAAEHLVCAAHELTLAIKVVVDALERGLADQRDALADGDARDRGTDEPRVRRIDLD